MTRLTFLGTSDAFNAAGRRNAAYLIQDSGETIALDFGPTALLALRTLDIPPNSIDAVVLTHLHGDHCSGLPFLILDGVYSSRRPSPLTILGPAGTRRRLDILLESTYENLVWAPRPYPVNVDEILPNTTTSFRSWSLRAFPADHMDPPHSPLSLQVKTPSGRLLAFSGDTQWCDSLLQCARGSDLLVAECSGLAPPMGRHCTWQDWLARHHELDTRRILLSHLDASVRAAIPRLLAELPPNTPLSFADDGLIIEL